jgi:pyrimidine deaminase RibD-like protein
MNPIVVNAHRLLRVMIDTGTEEWSTYETEVVLAMKNKRVSALQRLNHQFARDHGSLIGISSKRLRELSGLQPDDINDAIAWLEDREAIVVRSGNRRDDSFDCVQRVTFSGKYLFHELEKGTQARQGDRQYMELAVEEAKKSRDEDGGPHPRVGAVVVRDGKILATAYRGETGLGDHAEFGALEKKLGRELVSGATVYTTLEPCTTRHHPKVPCAERLLERGVRRVVIGMHDPNPKISGEGFLCLRTAKIVTELFPDDLMGVIEEMNRDFTRAHRSTTHHLSVG